MGDISTSHREQVKTILFLLFVLINVVLIFLIWSDNLTERSPENQGFVRGAQVFPTESSDNPLDIMPDQDLDVDDSSIPSPPPTLQPEKENFDLGDIGQLLTSSPMTRRS
jgi:hypothetical protein